MTRTPALRSLRAALALLLLAACIEIKDEDAPASKTSAQPNAPSTATPVSETAPDTADISAPSYALSALDTAGLAQQLPPELADSATKTSRISSADAPLTKFPAKILGRGPVPLQLQILLDRSNFSPGIVDGTWGSNAAKALAFFASSDAAAADTSSMSKQRSTIDRATYDRLRAAAGSEPALRKYTITESDLSGPFVKIPDSVYQQAKLPCLCYSTAAEAIAERFHTTQKLLAQLNPGITLDNLRAGAVLTVPNVDNERQASATDSIPIARLIVSRTGFWTHAVDASGRILFHFPSTLGAGYDPSPSGDFKIVSVAHNPKFHYQPKLFAEVPDTKPEARLPAGPNSPVGVVWIGLSKPHYGIHGTSAPETIGYANSHGCVRLTNWDAQQLSDLVESGTPVVFR
ncbi:MAG TPA: L,D-transpeptidase family protein [Gemmatimonadaceae bacterium]|nr:L,D-transpeptidase family protein [Gemmatimonadaceae bacterium]